MTAYEELRRAALEDADRRVRRAAGLVLVLRAGIAGWMHACRCVPSPVAAVAPSGEIMPALPRAVRADVTVLLAEMALAAAAERAS